MKLTNAFLMKFRRILADFEPTLHPFSACRLPHPRASPRRSLGARTSGPEFGAPPFVRIRSIRERDVSRSLPLRRCVRLSVRPSVLSSVRPPSPSPSSSLMARIPPLMKRGRGGGGGDEGDEHERKNERRRRRRFTHFSASLSPCLSLGLSAGRGLRHACIAEEGGSGGRKRTSLDSRAELCSVVCTALHRWPMTTG